MTTATNFSKKTAAIIAAFLTIFAMLSAGVTPAHAAATTIGGTVTDASGNAISGVTVTATSATATPNSITATTDSSGVYSLTNANDATDWKISFAKTGYATEFYNDKTTASAANSVTTSGTAVTGINATLAAEGVISGVTYNAASAILTSVTVQLYLDGVAYGSSITSNGTTGAYSFSQLPAGSYTLGFSKTGYVTQFSGGAATLAASTAFSINAGSTNTRNVNLVQQGVITGTTTPGGVSVVVRKADGTLVDNSVTSAAGATGAYTIANLDPGTYYLGFTLNSYISEFWNDSANFVGSTAVTVTAGATTSSISPTLVANPGSGTIDTTGATVTISGTPTEGQTLTASTSGWPTTGTVYNYQWQSYNGTSWSNITDAITASYVVKADDYNKNLRVSVIGSRIGYVSSSAVNSSQTAAVAHAFTTAPIPTITGTPAVGQTLTANTGTWAPTPTSYTYQWYYGGAIIPGETASTYTVTNFVVGWPITVAVTALKTDYPNTTRTSAATLSVGALMTVTPAPTISGTAVVGKTLTAVNGAWTPSNVAFAYQWNRGGVAISGATASSYTLVAADLNYSISVTVTATATGFTTTIRSSAGTSTVLDRLTTTPTPTITGNTTVGSVLTANPGTWAPAPVTLAYQWFRNSVAIAGATATTYTLTAADDLTFITLKVTGSRAGYGDETVTSANFQVGKPLTLHPTPLLTGNHWVGQTLKAIAGRWDTGATVTFQWFRAGVAVPGATRSSYLLTSADVGKTITVATTGSLATFVPKTETSAASKVILTGRPFVRAPKPTISGNARVGANLTVNRGVWNPTPSKYYYQWYRNGVAIAGATKSTYKTTAADLGANITVSVKAAKTGYATTAVRSNPTVSIK